MRHANIEQDQIDFIIEVKRLNITGVGSRENRRISSLAQHFFQQFNVDDLIINQQDIGVDNIAFGNHFSARLQINTYTHRF
jgi:hypothetical protein